jgi:hypothetical protein
MTASDHAVDVLLDGLAAHARYSVTIQTNGRRLNSHRPA